MFCCFKSKQCLKTKILLQEKQIMLLEHEIATLKDCIMMITSTNIDLHRENNAVKEENQHLEKAAK